MHNYYIEQVKLRGSNPHPFYCLHSKHKDYKTARRHYERAKIEQPQAEFVFSYSDDYNVQFIARYNHRMIND